MLPAGALEPTEKRANVGLRRIVRHVADDDALFVVRERRGAQQSALVLHRDLAAEVARHVLARQPSRGRLAGTNGFESARRHRRAAEGVARRAPRLGAPQVRLNGLVALRSLVRPAPGCARLADAVDRQHVLAIALHRRIVALVHARLVRAHGHGTVRLAKAHHAPCVRALGACPACGWMPSAERAC